MSRNKNIIRIEDTIRVLNPEFVARVGYPLSFNEACKIIDERDNEKILKAMDSLFGNEDPVYSSDLLAKMSLNTNWKFTKGERNLYNDLVRTMAYYEVGKTNYKTGTERKIYTRPEPQFLNKEMKVTSKRCAKTGFYYPSCGGYDSYTGEYDYEAGGLSKEKTHIILEVYPIMYGYLISYGDKLEIEICNVEKVNE